MTGTKPFIPRDKPRSWVVFICSGLLGMAVGVVGFGFAWLGIKIIQAIAIALFILCWVICAISWLVFIFSLVSGRYSNLQPKSWSEQVW